MTERDKHLRVADDVGAGSSGNAAQWAFALAINPSGTTRLEWVSREFVALTGYSAEELGGTNFWLRMVDPGHHETARAALAALLRGEEWRGSFSVVTKAGRTGWLRCVTWPVRRIGRRKGVLVFGSGQRLDGPDTGTAAGAGGAADEEEFEAFLLLDRDGNERGGNSMAGTLLGGRVFEGIHPDDVDRLQRARKKVLAKEGSSARVVFRARRSNGGWRWIEGALHNLARIPEVGGVLCVLRDVTRRWATRDILRRSEDFWRLVVDNAPDVIVVADTEGTVVFLSRLRSGWSWEHVIGRSVFDFVPEAQRDDVRRRLDGVLCSRRATEFETSVVDPGGKTQWNRIRVGPLIEGAEVRGLIMVATNTTERKQAEEALRGSEERWRSLVASVPEFIFEIDGNGKILFINRTVPGYAKEDVVGTCVLDWVQPDERAVWRRQIDAALRGEGAEPWNSLIVKPDGEHIWFRLRVGPIGRGGGVATLIVVGTDVTETHHAEATLRETSHALTRRTAELAAMVDELHGENVERQRAEAEASKSRGELRDLWREMSRQQEEERRHIAREIHDEFGQCLTALKMDLRWLATRVARDDDTAQRRVEQALQMVDTTISGVRRLARELRPGALDDLGLVAALESYAHEFASRSGVRCRLSMSPEELTVGGEEALAVFRIVQEALTNVARHARATGVRIALKRSAALLKLSIRDNGVGIQAKDVSSSTSLGLIGIRERAEQCGGTMSIEGRRGRGTVLRVEIPLKKETRAAGRRTPIATAPSRGRARKAGSRK